MPEILRLTLTREYFARFAKRQKHTEYREQKPYWRKRLEGRQFKTILFLSHPAPDRMAMRS
jgi:hypothetical protein